MSDPAESKTPRKPRTAKLPKAEAVIANIITHDSTKPPAVVPTGTKEKLTYKGAEVVFNDEMPAHAPPPARGKMSDYSMREVEVKVSPQGEVSRQPSPTFKYEYQRIEHQKRLDRMKD